MPITRTELYARLQNRPDDAAAAHAFDAAIRDELSQTVAVLITDLSGFTRLTKQHGILHFLAIFQRAVNLAIPEFEAQGGRLLKTAADNMIAVFPDPLKALAAARAMLIAAERDNVNHPSDGHIRICCGIGYGPILLMADDAFGDDLNVAFKLGEDIAEPSEILISAKAADELRANGLDEGELLGPRSETLGGVDLVHYAAK